MIVNVVKVVDKIETGISVLNAGDIIIADDIAILLSYADARPSDFKLINLKDGSTIGFKSAQDVFDLTYVKVKKLSAEVE